MHLAYLLLFTGLTISAVAIYYSVIGLAAIFSAAAIPVYIMGTTLEVAKLVGASWLKANWDRAPAFIRTYMLVAILMLMTITSMGIFGFLSKAHSDQSMPTGDVIDKIAILDEQVNTQKENIDAARKALRQMDDSVDQTVARSTSEKSVTRAVDIRRSQNKERSLLRNSIEEAQREIARLKQERAPIAKDLRRVEAEVGPIKYIAKFVYNDNPDQNILEKAVTWVIIMIVIVFDPLAVIMLLAAQMSFVWNKEIVTDSVVLPPVVTQVEEEPADVTEVEEVIEPIEVIQPETTNQEYQRSSLKPIDQLYKEYAVDQFANLAIDPEHDPELADFIESSKERPRFSSYSADMLSYFARRIYELRKNNSNNTAG